MSHSYGMNFCTAKEGIIVIPDRSHGEIIVTSIKNYTVNKEGRVEPKVFDDFLKDHIKNLSQNIELNLLDIEKFSKHCNNVALKIVSELCDLRELLLIYGAIRSSTSSDDCYASENLYLVFKLADDKDNPFRANEMSYGKLTCLKSSNKEKLAKIIESKVDDIDYCVCSLFILLL